MSITWIFIQWQEVQPNSSISIHSAISEKSRLNFTGIKWFYSLVCSQLSSRMGTQSQAKPFFDIEQGGIFLYPNTVRPSIKLRTKALRSCIQDVPIHLLCMWCVEETEINVQWVYHFTRVELELTIIWTLFLRYQ